MVSGKESQTVMISDFLGTTLGVVRGEEFVPMPMTAFGEFTSSASKENSAFSILHSSLFFTGKPYDSDLKAYTFLFRNYRPELGRWTAKDPAGFPDGANNWLYCNNEVVGAVDVLGLLAPPMLYQISYAVKSGVSLDSAQLTVLQRMITYAQAVVLRLNTETAKYNLAVTQSGIVDGNYSGNYNSGAINWENFAPGTIYVVGNINNYQPGGDITAGTAGVGTAILINAQYLSFGLDAYRSPLAHEMGHVGGYEGHSTDPNNVMWENICQIIDPDVVALDNFYKDVVRSLAQLE